MFNHLLNVLLENNELQVVLDSKEKQNDYEKI